MVSQSHATSSARAHHDERTDTASQKAARGYHTSARLFAPETKGHEAVEPKDGQVGGYQSGHEVKEADDILKEKEAEKGQVRLTSA